MRLHLGCGAVVADGWVNVDYAVGARLRNIPIIGGMVGKLGILRTNWNPDIVVHDLRKPLPWATGSADAIYTSHTLEHLDRLQGRRLVEECHRVLKPGGLLRIVVPDLKGYVAEYERGQLPATDLLYELHVAGARGLGLKRDIFSLLSGGSHRYMYDGPTLTRLLRDAGFEPRVCKPQESEIPDMDRLEPGPEKWTPEKLARNLYLEGQKARGRVENSGQISGNGAAGVN